MQCPVCHHTLVQMRHPQTGKVYWVCEACNYSKAKD